MEKADTYRGENRRTEKVTLSYRSIAITGMLRSDAMENDRRN